LNETLIDEYLRRIGARRPARPDLAGLRHLQERQIMTVPFENLGYHLDEPIQMNEEVLQKVVRDRRGGGCYEVNPALGFLLGALGYSVEILPGRVYRGGRIGPPMCHLVLRVEAEGERWLVDTGFGRNSRHPLRFGSREPQADLNGEYRLADAEDGGLDLFLDDKPLYRVDERPVQLDDFRPTLWWYRTCPDSPFLQDLFCSIPTADGRVTLKGTVLTRQKGKERITEELPDDAAVLAAYKDHFGIGLDKLPREPKVESLGIQLG
jgi:N-hydroxyarylamine O-acetyltransferase